ncbi:hypothetical protein [Micromonospora narathiwatensis]|uniref:hypothetical protein n=1 Tax=Micromonospora narathiwatensis TaxID=299146 RepID=UPI0012FDE0E5|nr:hypothetical protein [Micromonospora narathiwatensis]
MRPSDGADYSLIRWSIDRCAGPVYFGQDEPSLFIEAVHGYGDRAYIFESQHEDGIEVAEEGEPLALLVIVANQVASGMPAAVGGSNDHRDLSAAKQGG